MADSFMADMEEVNSLARDLDIESNQARFKASTVIRAGAQRVVGVAQTFVPVDTGATKSSIFASAAGGGPLGLQTLDAEIGPTTEYAPHLEFGTVKMAPHAFMGPALDRVAPDVVAALGEIVDL